MQDSPLRRVFRRYRIALQYDPHEQTWTSSTVDTYALNEGSRDAWELGGGIEFVYKGARMEDAVAAAERELRALAKDDKESPRPGSD
jgi:hypothetical protein